MSNRNSEVPERVWIDDTGVMWRGGLSDDDTEYIRIDKYDEALKAVDLMIIDRDAFHDEIREAFDIWNKIPNFTEKEKEFQSEYCSPVNTRAGGYYAGYTTAQKKSLAEIEECWKSIHKQNTAQIKMVTTNTELRLRIKELEKQIEDMK